MNGYLAALHAGQAKKRCPSDLDVAGLLYRHRISLDQYRCTATSGLTRSDPMSRELGYLTDDAPQVLPGVGNVAAFHYPPADDRFPNRHGNKRKCALWQSRSSPAAPWFGPNGLRFWDIWDEAKPQ